MIWIILALVWALGALIAYPVIDKKTDDEDTEKWEKVWYAAIWPCTLLLYCIYAVRRRFGK